VRNVSDKSYRENRNTHFAFSEYFPKILPFVIECGKNTKCIVAFRCNNGSRNAHCLSCL